MAWKLQFRIYILNVTIPLVPAATEIIGYPTPGIVGTIADGFAAITGGVFTADVITSLSKAISIASSGVRRYTSLGTDVVAIVLGMPVGTDDPASLSPLPAAAQKEQRYAAIDVPSRDLKHAIRVASKPPVGAGIYGSDFQSDLAGETYQA